MNKRKICVFTGTRAEYGLLYWLTKRIQKDNALELQLVVGGMHLSPEFGLTYKDIEKDGFCISKRVETLLSSDSSVGVSKSIGLGIISLSEVFDELKPDILVLLGDRFEVFAAATAAMINKTAIAHCHGGEATEGLIDEPIRHSITKMSHIHFTSTETYRNRVIQLGEQPDRVFNVGALGIENINKLKLQSRKEFELAIGRTLDKRNIIVTFHPVTLETASAEKQFRILLEVLDTLQDTLIIFTKANADTDGRIINQLIDIYVSKNQSRAIAFTSLGQLRYLSGLQYIDVVVGNSSSGLIEAPSFKKPTINIGDRQRGRVKGRTIIDCDPNFKSIKTAVEKGFSKVFLDQIKDAKNPYGVNNPSEEIVNVLKDIELENLIKKRFNDIV